MSTPPVAAVRPSVREHHGDLFVDQYAWLSRTDDSRTRAYLDEENAYTAAATAHLGPLREELVAEIRSRVKETDLSVPVLDRGWWYYSRTAAGRQYAAECRVEALPGQARPTPEPGVPLPGEQVLIDGDVEAAGGDYFALGACEVDRSGRLVAFAVDRRGDERFDVSVRRIEDGATLDDAVRGVGYGLVWTADGEHVVYTRVDDAWRPHEVWLHHLGSDPSADRLLLREPDERFWLSIGESRDGRWLVVSSAAKNTSEVWLADLTSLADAGSLTDAGSLADAGGVEGERRALPAFTSVAGRTEGVEYEVEPAGPGIFLTHNETSPDFGVDWAPLGERGPGAGQLAPREARVEWLSPTQGVRYLGVDAFAGQVVVARRADGLPQLALALPDASAATGWGEPEPMVIGDETLATVALGANPQWRSESLRLVAESFVTPRSVLEYEVATGALTVLKRQEVPGYDAAAYRQRREWVTAQDGTRIPLSVVYRSDLFDGSGRDGEGVDGSGRGGEGIDGEGPWGRSEDGPAAILYGYGAYEASLDPWFSVFRPSLLDRGVVFAVAHVRGGGEMGRSWYEQARLGAKLTTFTDMVACARHLIDRGWCAPDRLGLQGASAGGLTVGATLNLAPELFAVAHADVPFVDALSTMLDESLPLTVVERDEWGDPLHDADAYTCMRSYTPYENIRPVTYPAILATTSLNDTRVKVTEPAKWVAALRETVRQDPEERPILLRTEMEAGHGGRSGRYDAWEQYAFEAAFLLDRLGATALLPRR